VVHKFLLIPAEKPVFYGGDGNLYHKPR
jgi:hypothetical protein